MAENKIERYFCNVCKGRTKHFVRAEYNKNDEDEVLVYRQRMLIVECCGCENLELVKLSFLSGSVIYDNDSDEKWDESIFPPVTYRVAPEWFDDLPDPTLVKIFGEIYKSLQTESYYLATFGSRTLIDRLIVLTVGDQGSFAKGLAALQGQGKISDHERTILDPVVQAGHAAAHRGWAPTRDQLATILDTVEGLIRRLLVLPQLAEELDEAVPGYGGSTKTTGMKAVITASEKIDKAPQQIKDLYDALLNRSKALGEDVSIHPQKHYIAFRRNRNFASVQVYNTKRVIKIYLNLDPDELELDPSYMRDVRQIGHFGTGDLEVNLAANTDLDRTMELVSRSYDVS
ncbi:DUF5655 domain-containing protein [Bauldia sp.]|uniref:DUF5655 domain-containing protein n=1 Tax=Bauldia sp. TaxID=2575872 RepID=UPI003BA94B22